MVKSTPQKFDYFVLVCFNKTHIIALKSFQEELSNNDEKGIDFNPLLSFACCCNRVDIAEFIVNQDLCYIKEHLIKNILKK